MLHVDHVVWPRICTQLHMVAVQQLDQLTAALLNAVESGRKALAVGGCRAGDGATTMLLCAARQLARRGLRVLAADACFHDPQLARRLGMLPDVGWQDALAGRVPLEEAIIVSAEDRLALLPAATRPSSLRKAFALTGALNASLDELAQHYDVILVDVGSLEDCLSHRRRRSAAAAASMRPSWCTISTRPTPRDWQTLNASWPTPAWSKWASSKTLSALPDLPMKSNRLAFGRSSEAPACRRSAFFCRLFKPQ